MKKKATLSFSVKFIVGIILILIFLILFLAFIRSYFQKSRIRLEEQMVVGAPKPYVEIVSPEDYEIFEVGDDVNFRSFVHSYTPKVKIVGYFWDFDGDEYIDSREEHYKRAYYEPGDYNITLKALNDLGGIGSDSVIVRIFTKNKKNLSKYEGDPVFFIPSEMNYYPQVENWKEILKVIPLTRWYDKNGDHKYDYIAIAKGEISPTIVPDDIKEKLDLMNKKNGVVFDVGGISLSNGYTIRNENANDLANYFSYWEEYYSVVLVDENNFDGALIAALFAAYYNSPLVFIPNRVDGDYSDYDPYLLGKKFYVIYSPPFTLPSSAYEYYIVDVKIDDWTHYNSTELRDPLRKINRIIKLESKLFVSD